jgi:hypothetical protein
MRRYRRARMKKTAFRVVILGALFAAVFVAACVHQQTGRFAESSFVGTEGRFGFSYLDRSGGRLLPTTWTLENWTVDANGKPDAQKDQGMYLSEAQWPLPDGSMKWMKFLTHELRYDHPSSGATVWVRVLPLPPREASLSLKVIAETWANTVSGTVFDYTFKGAEGATRLGSRILATGSATVAGYPAHQVVFDVVNLDQLQADPNAPRSRVQAYFVGAPVAKELFAPGGTWRSVACVFIGLAAPAERFDSVVPDFASLVSRMWVETPNAAAQAPAASTVTRPSLGKDWTRRQ